jgi:hypothetical protein
MADERDGSVGDATRQGRVTRREVVGTMGSTVVGAGVGVAALPPAPTTPVPSKAETGPKTDGDAVAEAETPFAVWHYKPTGEGFTPTAPINVVFPLQDRSFQDVVSVFRAAGWYRSPEEYARYAWDRTENRYRRQDWTAAESYFGLHGRLHVRCWSLEGTASVQAHVDSEARPKHGIASYARGRRAVERLFTDAGWTVADDRFVLANEKGPDHDGWASVING